MIKLPYRVEYKDGSEWVYLCRAATVEEAQEIMAQYPDDEMRYVER